MPISRQNLYGLLSRGALSLALLGVVLGCGGSPPKPQNAFQAEMAGAPKWAQGSCQAGLRSKKAICGTARVSGMTNVALARSFAENHARTELAYSLQTRVKAMLEDYQTPTQGGPENRTANEQHIEDLSKQITDATLSGTRVEDTWISNAGTFCALVVLDTESFKNSLANMKQLDERLRAALVERVDQAFSQQQGLVFSKPDRELTKGVIRSYNPPGPAPEPADGCAANQVFIPGGVFAMAEIEKSGWLSPYCIDKIQVTTAAYNACVKAGPCGNPDWGRDCHWPPLGLDQRPINCVDLNQARTYCKWAGGRLPTEEEWEYAARGNCHWDVKVGNWECGEEKWEYAAQGNKAPNAVKRGSPFGVLDMATDVWEWNDDSYAEHKRYWFRPQHQSDLELRWEYIGGCYRIGGADRLREAFHISSGAWTRRFCDVGFRCARLAASDTSRNGWQRDLLS